MRTWNACIHTYVHTLFYTHVRYICIYIHCTVLQHTYGHVHMFSTHQIVLYTIEHKIMAG